jgi:hypothetical protein
MSRTLENIFIFWSSTHNILEPVVRRPSSYSAKHCSKSLLQKDFIPFLSSYAHSSIATCTFLLPLVVLVVLVLVVLSNFWHQFCLDSFSEGRPSTGSRMLYCNVSWRNSEQEGSARPGCFWLCFQLDVGGKSDETSVSFSSSGCM